MTAIDSGHVPTEIKNIILSYPSITQIMVDSHYEILWADNSGADLGHHPTSKYSAGIYDAEKQAIIAQQRLRSKMLGLWIKNSLTTDAKCKLRYFNSAYSFKSQYDGAAIFLVIFKMV